MSTLKPPSDDGSANLERFKAAMPRVPGVDDSLPEQTQREAVGDGAPRNPSARIVALLLAALALGAAGVWWMHRPARSVASSGEASPLSPSSLTASAASAASPETGVDVASLQELGEPWSAKKFFFRKPFSGESVPAMVIRLPGDAANAPAAYWAFSLQTPFGHCELEYVTDLGTLAEQYGYRARHPMVRDACSRAVYDPLRMGTLPDGAWVRGEVVQGPGLRPPFAIEVQICGSRLVATRIE